ncbi:MAG: helix-turn-helix domain-containing protein [Myxococcota bacterium]
MAGTRTYAIGTGWRAMLDQIGVDPIATVLRADLPRALLDGGEARLPPESIYRLYRTIEAMVERPEVWVQLVEAMRAECFTPPIFAALCGPDLVTAAHRLSLFKPLIGPVELQIDEDTDGLHLTYQWQDSVVQPPTCMHLVEALFVVRLARMGTGQPIEPASVHLPECPEPRDVYVQYLGAPLREGPALRVSFRTEDARRPFLTSNAAMWSVFEPELRRRLGDLDARASFTDRTQAVLLEALPSGQFAMDKVARRLAVSTRTLQRRLREEGTHFTDVVSDTRLRLARHYLGQPNITSTEIAYLLGFEEPTSFIRACQRWTGTTPDGLRRQLRRGMPRATARTVQRDDSTSA